jgi:hypothetical protein
MPDGGELRVTLNAPPGPINVGTGMACLIVEDTGRGMSPDVRARVFEPFFTTKPRGVGTGLGLSSAHGIITDHDGHIHAGSKPGKGTRFAIHIPMCLPPGELATARLPQDRPAATVLLAEHDAFVRQVAADGLRDAGYQVVAVEDAVAALEGLETQGSIMGLAVVDLALPQAGDRTLLHELRARRSDLPALVLASDGQQPPADLPGPPCRLLARPFNVQRLVDEVARTLADQPSESARSADD